jgi:hypothetical protein
VFVVTALGGGNVQLDAGGQSKIGYGSASITIESASISAIASAENFVELSWSAESHGHCQ